MTRDLVQQFGALFTGGTLSGLGEGELLERFVHRRDEAAFAEIVARHGPMVLGVCRRWLDDPHEVEDAFQATFLVLVRKAAGLRDRDSVGPWLFGVSHRVARHARAASARRRAGEVRSRDRFRQESARSAGPDPSDELAGREVLAMVDEEILRLPPRQREAAVLGLVQGMTHQAAAQALGWPLGTFKTRVADARARLARRLGRRGVGPTALAMLGQPEAALFPKVVPPDGLARRVVEAAVAGSGAGRDVAASTAAELARRAWRGMIVARVSAVAVGIAAACALAVPAWLIGRPGPDPGAPAIAAPARPPAAPPRLDRYGDRLPAGALLRLGTVRYRQPSPIYRIAYSVDGRHIVTDGDDGKLRVWDAATGSVVRQIDPQAGVLSDFGLTPDGKTAMTAGFTLEKGRGIFRNVTFTEIETGRVVSRSTWAERNAVAQVALSPARRRLALGLTVKQSAVIIQDARTGVEFDRVELAASPHRLAFSPDGSRLAIELNRSDGAQASGCVIVRDVENRREILTIPDSELGFGDLAFSPDGKYLAVPATMAPGVWDTSTGQKLNTNGALFRPFAFSPDGRSLKGIAANGRMSIWDLARGRETDHFATKVIPDFLAVLSPDGRALASTGGPNVLHLWDLAERRDRFAAPDAHRGRINALTITPDGKTLVSAGEDQTVRVWDLADGRSIRTFPHGIAVGRLQLSADGRRVATATSTFNGVWIWDLHGGDRDVARSGVMMMPGRPLALRFGDAEDSILEIASNGELYGFDFHDSPVRELGPLPLKPPEPPFDQFPDHLNAGAFLEGGRKAAVAGTLTGFQLLDLEARKVLYQIPKVSRFVVSRDEAIVAMARNAGDETYARMGRGLADTVGFAEEKHAIGGTITLVERASGKETVRIDVPGSEVCAMAFSPDGRTLAATSGWEAGRIHFYDVATGREIRTIECPPLRSPALIFTPDGSRLVSGMADGSILVWDVRPDR